MKNNIIKGMMQQTEDFYDSLFWRSLAEGFFPVLHDKYYSEDGEFYCGRFSIKFNGEVYTFTVEEGEADILLPNVEFTDDMPARYVTVKRGDIEVYSGFDIPGHWEPGDSTGWHYDLSQLIEEWEGLLSYDRNKWRRSLLR